MALSYDLTTLPEQALDILRYLGRTHIEQADADTIMGGTGMSDRSFSKGIKRLVTKNYMTMDGARIYHLTPKGADAIKEIAEFDAISPRPISTQANIQTINYDLCVVVPPGTIQPNYPSTWMLGLEPLGSDLTQEAHLVVRLDSIGGEVSHREFTASVSPEMPVLYAEFSVTPNGSTTHFRLRIEAFQSIRMDTLEEAGGMYIDIPLNQSIAAPRALHTDLSVIV